jgi:ubiquitin-conjugating enzyme E2 T
MASHQLLPGNSSSSSKSVQQTPVLSSIATQRLKRELVRLQQDPPPGIAAYLSNDSASSASGSADGDDLSKWTAQIRGPVDTPFEGGIFFISMIIPSRYPMEPPVCQFVSPNIPYHPNIDEAGRICLDTLKRPPVGLWSPAVNLTTLLLSLQSLLQEPNPDDGLLPEVSRLYRDNRQAWWDEAKRRVTASSTSSNSIAAGSSVNDNDDDKNKTKCTAESIKNEKRNASAVVDEQQESETKESQDPKRLKTRL